MDGKEAPGGDASPVVTTEEAFQEALERLVIEAEGNGVDVRGGWPVVDDETGMWDVEVTRVARVSTAHVGEKDTPVAAVVEAVAEREGVDPTDLPPIQDAIDHEILERLLDTVDDPHRHVRFEYCEYTITVRADGSIRLDG
jgi:hypothetical protein